MSIEIWKILDNTNYEISSHGNVRKIGEEKYLKQHFLNNNKENRKYKRVRLKINNVLKSFLVHRLVLITFARYPKEKEECLHLNNIPWDNRIENLKWGTHKENMNLDKGNNHSHKKEANPNSKLTQKDVDFIREKADIDLSRDELSKMFNINKQHIGRIIRKENWN